MEFGCSICGYTSTQKEHVINHINRKRSCGPGDKTIVEIPVEIKCEYCQKNFSTNRTLERHMRNTCKNKKDQLEEENKKLKEKVKELEKNQTTTINNQTNNNTFNIIIVNNYEDTKLDKITDRTYNKIIKDADEVYQIIPRLIKEIHFNPNIPENHNIVLSNRNKNNKHLQVYRDKHWEIEKKDAEIDNLINDKETNLSDWVAEKGEKYPEAMEKFNEYLEQKYDEDVSKLVKEEVELVLYNNRHIVKTN
jgi:exonuclease VII large subunit